MAAQPFARRGEGEATCHTGPALSHLQAVLAMIAASALWGIAGLVSRQLQTHEGLEITFWRSVFAALGVGVWLVGGRQLGRLRATLRGGAPVWISGVMWSIMFTCFMVSLSLTSVANVLIV